MLKKIMALAATTAMLGANAAAYALNTARAAVRGVTGASSTGAETAGSKTDSPTTPGDKSAKGQPHDGRHIQPSIPPLPKDPPATSARPKGSAPKVAGHKANRVKPRIRKQGGRKRPGK